MKDELSSSKMTHEDNLNSEKKELGKLIPRATWGRRLEFILACVGAAVGLGNVWRFPYLAYKNGGGAFLIPYVVMVFLIGFPIFLIELTIGQYSAMGPFNLFRHMCPLFKGLGAAMVLTTSFTCTYYILIIAWTMYYFFDSFREELKWQFCSHDFNTNSCFEDRKFRSCKAENENNVFYNRTCFDSSYAEIHGITDIPEKERVASSEEYFNLHVLEKSSGIGELGSMRWQILLALIGAWIIVACCVSKGIKTTGKVVYFTSTFPYVILLILFIRGATLSGSASGMSYFIVPDFSKLNNPTVWEDATIQAFYSLSIAGGSMITYASYNRFTNSIIVDSIVICVIDTLTCVFSGLVIFSMTGFIAEEMGKPVSNVVQSGAGLAFIVYADGITRMSVAPLWSLLFFFMLFLLGITTQFSVMETITTSIYDAFPRTRKRQYLVVIALAVFFLICALPLATHGGIYVLELLDTYSAGWPYMLNGLLECLVISFIYGIGNFLDDLKEMTGFNPNRCLRISIHVSIMIICPLIILILLLVSLINYIPLQYGDYVYPWWANLIGWLLAVITVSLIPLGVIHELFYRNRQVAFKKRFQKSLKPTEEWRKNYQKNKATVDSKTDPLQAELVPSNADAIDTNKFHPEITSSDNLETNESTSPENANANKKEEQKEF